MSDSQTIGMTQVFSGRAAPWAFGGSIRFILRKKVPFNIMAATSNYREMFPEAVLDVEVKESTSCIGPPRLSDFIKYVFAAGRHPKWVKISHMPLLKYVQIVFFDGLDESRYSKFFANLSEFNDIMGKGFPLSVVASSKGGQFQNGVDSVIGLNRNLKKNVCFESFEEMLATPEQLVDNGFPIRGGPVLDGKLRCEHFHLDPLKEEDLFEYEKLPEHVDGALSVMALDCEMIETDLGDECARLSVVKEDGSVVLDQIFKPLGDVVDLRTELSGITQEKLAEAKSTSYEVVKALAQFADQKTIIIGHSVENDFRAMKLMHSRVIDTSLVYNKDAQYPHKPPLARLYEKYIKKPFRVELEAHDSIDDARAALDLVKYAMKKPIHRVVVPPQVPTLFQELKERVCQIRVFGCPEDCIYADLDDQIKCEVNEDFDVLCDRFIEAVQNERPPLTVIQFGQLAKCQITDEDEAAACTKYNEYLKKIRSSIPPESLTIIYTGTGNMNRLVTNIKSLDPKHQNPGKDPNRKEEFEQCRHGLCWILSKSQATEKTDEVK